MSIKFYVFLIPQMDYSVFSFLFPKMFLTLLIILGLWTFISRLSLNIVNVSRLMSVL